MDDQKNIKPDFSKAGEDSILYKKEEPKTEREKLKDWIRIKAKCLSAVIWEPRQMKTTGHPQRAFR